MASNTRDLRQELMWNAMKARKANLIDARALEVIRKLCREPSNPATDEKVRTFGEQFMNRIEGRVATSPRAARSDNSEFRPDADFRVSLPSVVLSRILEFLATEDAISFASTSYAICSGALPAHLWTLMIRRKWEALRPPVLPDESEPVAALQQPQFDANGGIIDVQAAQLRERERREAARKAKAAREERLLRLLESENLFPAHHADSDETPIQRRTFTLQCFGRGTQLLRQTSQNALAYFIMLRLMLPRIARGEYRMKLTSTISVPNRGRLASGAPLALANISGDSDLEHIHMLFKVPLGAATPALVALGRSDFSLHALESDGRAITEVRRWTVNTSIAHSSVQLIDPLHHVSGTAYVTTTGERAAKYLGVLLHGDEHHYAREVSSSASGSHGMGSYDVRRVVEDITHQTPRTVYKAPQGYFEVSERNGVEVKLPLEILFQHCCI